MRSLKLCGILLVLVAMVACDKKSSDNQAKAAESSTLPAAAAPAKVDIARAEGDSGAKKEASAAVSEIIVKVLDPGQAPRQELRYKFAPGKLSTMIMDMKMDMTMEMAGMKQPQVALPLIRSTMTINNKEVTADGNLRYEFKLTKAEIVPDKNAVPQVVAAMESEIKKIVGMSGWALVDNRGMVKDASVETPPGAGQQIEQLVNDMRQQIRQLSAPLPMEAVGKGAKWEVHMPMSTPTLTFSQVATYSLDDFKGSLGKFGVVIEQKAPPQKMNAPGMPAGADVFLDSLTSSGKGTVNFDLTQLVPTSTMKLSTAMGMNVSAQGQKQNVKTNMNMEISISQPNK